MKTVLVLGGGFSGLSAAIHLALAGAKVTLLEQQPTLGGKAGEVITGGYRFDIGPSVFTLPEIVTGIFEAAGERPPRFDRLEPLCRYHYPSGRVWDVYQDVAKTTAALTAADAKAYRALLNEARTLYDAASPTFVFGQAPGVLALSRYGLRHGLRAHPGKKLVDLIRQHGASSDLERFFLRFATYFGADPYRAPAVLHNIAWVELGLGVYYPEGGVAGVVRALGQLAHTLGVELHTGVTVERLELHAGRITRVHSDQGAFGADVVVSSLDIIRTHRLMGRPTRQSRQEPSLSGFVLLLGVTGETPGLAHHNISFPEDYRTEFAAVRRGELPHDPTLYLSLSSKSRLEDAPAGSENWFVLVNAPALGERSIDWQAEGERYAAHLLGVLARRGFDVRGRVEVQRIVTPAYLATLAHRGSIYGTAPHSLLSTLRPRQTVAGVKNLVLAGGSVHPGGGIPLALLSGQHAARLVLSSRSFMTHDT